MSALSPLFLWLIPLALLPVIIHLLNRLRYQTVPWAAMMFLRSADRDASRRARIRQWIILAARCLMLLMFLLALARLQSKGRLARFFDPESSLVVILFDRSASMEQERAGMPGRERALTLLEQGLDELGGSSRVLWMDSVDGDILPIPRGVELDRLPLTSATSTSSDLGGMVRRALAEIARADVSRAEIWIPTDRQTSAWLPEGAASPDWSEWTNLRDRVTLRVLDVARVPADPGNRSLTLVSEPVRTDQALRVSLALTRNDTNGESIPLRIETGGLTLQEDLLLEGSFFQWEQEIPLAPDSEVTHARFSLPADSNDRDNRVSVAWKDSGVLLAGGQALPAATLRILRAALLPRPGVREWDSVRSPDDDHLLWVSSRGPEDELRLDTWVQNGGVLVQWPVMESEVLSDSSEDPLTVGSWMESEGVLATRGREPLRLDLVEVFSAVDLPEDEETQVLARLSDGRPLLTRTRLGEGVHYRWATLPDSGFSTLEDGFVLVPVMQRMLLEASRRQEITGTVTVGQVRPESPEEWVSLDGEGRDVLLDAGRFRRGNQVLAQNRPDSENVRQTFPLSELESWANPLELRVFEDRSREGGAEAARSEFTGLLGLLGLLFLVIESWLLTRNIRRKTERRTAWGGAVS